MKRVEGIIILICGLLVLAFAWFVNNIYSPGNTADSSRLSDLNFIIGAIGKCPTVLLITVIGLAMLYFGYRKIKNK